MAVALSERLIIQGGRPLRGRIEVSGSKNASLYALAAAAPHRGLRHPAQRPRNCRHRRSRRVAARPRRGRAYRRNGRHDPGCRAHKLVRTSRARRVDACVVPRHGAAARAARRGRLPAARRRRHRRTTARRAPRGLPRARRRGRARRAGVGGARLEAAWDAHLPRLPERPRHGERALRGCARRGHHDHRQRRRRARGADGRGPAQRDGRAHQRHRQQHHHHRGRRAAAWRGVHRHPRPHRGRHVPPRGRRHRRRCRGSGRRRHAPRQPAWRSCARRASR